MKIRVRERITKNLSEIRTYNSYGDYWKNESIIYQLFVIPIKFCFLLFIKIPFLLLLSFLQLIVLLLLYPWKLIFAPQKAFPSFIPNTVKRIFGIIIILLAIFALFYLLSFVESVQKLP